MIVSMRFVRYRHYGAKSPMRMDTAEEAELLTEFMDWSRCLAVGLQSQKVFTKVYESYAEASKKRSEHIARHIDETLKAGEIGVLFMREGHQVQLPKEGNSAAGEKGGSR